MSRKKIFTVAAARARARTAADAIDVALEGALACVAARGGGSLRAEFGDRTWEVIGRAIRARGL